MNEYYDEFVFNDPTEYMYQLYPIASHRATP